MTLETYKWPDNWRYAKPGPKPKQTCEHYINDRSCETCPYPDCIASDRQIAEQIKANKEEAKE